MLKNVTRHLAFFPHLPTPAQCKGFSNKDLTISSSAILSPIQAKLVFDATGKCVEYITNQTQQRKGHGGDWHNYGMWATGQ